MQVKLTAVLSALQQQQLEKHCTALTDAWSQYWFGCVVNDCIISFNQGLFAQLPDLQDCQFYKQGVALHYQPKPTYNVVFSRAVPLKLAPQQEADKQLVAQFANKVLEDLSTRFKATQALVDIENEQEQWQMAITLKLNGQPIVIRLSASWVQDVAQKIRQADLQVEAAGLAERRLALQTELVAIAPRFAPVSIPLKQLLNLQIGSVITLAQPIAEPIPLFSNDKVTSMAGYLVDQQGKKALYITGHKHEQN